VPAPTLNELDELLFDDELDELLFDESEEFEEEFDEEFEELSALELSELSSEPSLEKSPSTEENHSELMGKVNTYVPQPAESKHENAIKSAVIANSKDFENFFFISYLPTSFR
jgi:hypothetical protein